MRVALHGRRVGGWVVADDVAPPPGVSLRPLAKVTGWGPPPEVLELAEWAAWRWAGRPVPAHGVAPRPLPCRPLPPPPGPPRPSPPADDASVGRALTAPGAVLRLPPAADRSTPVVAAAAAGRRARARSRRLAWRAGAPAPPRRAGPVALLPRLGGGAAGGRVVVGARAAAWAPAPDLAAVVVLDAHDEVYQEERAPTWNAWSVVAERAERAGASCVLVSPCPTLDQLAWGPVLTPSRRPSAPGGRRSRSSTGARRPRSGLFSDRLVAAVRSDSRVVCVLNRKGRARLLACAACGELARCERCGAAVAQDGELVLPALRDPAAGVRVLRRHRLKRCGPA